MGWKSCVYTLQRDRSQPYLHQLAYQILGVLKVLFFRGECDLLSDMASKLMALFCTLLKRHTQFEGWARLARAYDRNASSRPEGVFCCVDWFLNIHLHSFCLAELTMLHCSEAALASNLWDESFLPSNCSCGESWLLMGKWRCRLHAVQIYFRHWFCLVT